MLAYLLPLSSTIKHNELPLGISLSWHYRSPLHRTGIPAYSMSVESCTSYPANARYSGTSAPENTMHGSPSPTETAQIWGPHTAKVVAKFSTHGPATKPNDTQKQKSQDGDEQGKEALGATKAPGQACGVRGVRRAAHYSQTWPQYGICHANFGSTVR
ncbi:hypothetical protein N7466_003958 [Penicillium verhagenii]|uniref:uncharacterized protein n=1 Tax=Penicillium verhagenii TaxID=1562060 RepID=UPI0025458822|nr:uncharacterized protein N7466_003958 [Penicillium verhagenii]KAJ5934411.1 hypothetical protein N7466_003958 [Penicillium verhagenii]